MADLIDDPNLLLEWGVAHVLDPRQRAIYDYSCIWNENNTYELKKVKERWNTFEAFVTCIKECVVDYCQEIYE